jgi:hypothetical protein
MVRVRGQRSELGLNNISCTKYTVFVMPLISRDAGRPIAEVTVA